MMKYDDEARPSTGMWAVLAVLLLLCGLVMCATGCATCEPTIVKVPVEVEVPVPIPPEPLIPPPIVVLELCGVTEGTAQGKLQCVGRNIERLKAYAQAILDEVEAHNEAIPE